MNDYRIKQNYQGYYYIEKRDIASTVWTVCVSPTEDKEEIIFQFENLIKTGEADLIIDIEDLKAS